MTVLDGLSVAQTARRLGVSESFVRYLIRLGQLPATWTVLGHLISLRRSSGWPGSGRGNPGAVGARAAETLKSPRPPARHRRARAPRKTCYEESSP